MIIDSHAWDDGFYRSFWEAATSLGVPIFFSLSTGPEARSWEATTQARDGYANELKILMRWMERYPDTIISITHGFPHRSFIEGDRIVLPDAVYEPFQNPNLTIEVCFPRENRRHALPEPPLYLPAVDRPHRQVL